MSEQPDNLELRTECEAGITVVHVSGDIDLRSSPVLRDQFLGLLGESPARIILDLAGVPYIDSSGVGTIVELKRRVMKTAGDVVLVGLQERVRSVFEITKLDGFFKITETVDQARKL